MPGFGSLIPGFNPMQPPAMQNTGLGAMGAKILQQGLAQSRAATPGAAGGLGGMGGIAGLPPMGLLGMLLGRQQPQAGAPLNLAAPPAQPAMPLPVMPGAPTGLY